MTTLTDIRNFMLSQLTYDGEGDEYYDDDGHCGDGLYQEIKSFWANFSSDKDFEYLVTARWASDELDLSGGRSYLLSFEELIDMCFDYMYNTLKWSRSDYKSKIWNSCDFTYEILERYDNPAVKRDEKLKQVSKGIEDFLENTSADDLDKLYLATSALKSNEVDNIKDYIVIKYPKEMKSKLDKLEYFEFIGVSRLNDDVIYKINIPIGEVIENFKNTLRNK